MSKRAIEAMSVAAAAENFDKGIRINCVAPGPIDSDMYRLITVNEPAALKGAAVGQPEDVAALVAFLLSDEARHCSGHTYFVDGGVAA